MKLTVKLKGDEWRVTGIGRISEYVGPASRGIPTKQQILYAIGDAVEIDIVAPPGSKPKEKKPKKQKVEEKELTDSEILRAVYGARSLDSVRRTLMANSNPYEQIHHDVKAAVKNRKLLPADDTLAMGALIRMVTE
jgi:hypothetical protein